MLYSTDVLCHLYITALHFTTLAINFDFISDFSSRLQRDRLGPLLFIIYINDLIESCQQYSDIYVFADDAKFFRHVNQSQDSSELQEAINILHKWSSQWLLKLNII